MPEVGCAAVVDEDVCVFGRLSLIVEQLIPRSWRASDDFGHQIPDRRAFG